MVTATRTATRLRPMTAADIPAARALSREQRWPHRTADWTFLVQHGKGLVAERDGEVVGTTLTWEFGADAAALGLVIVSPRLQGQGIGRRLMEAAMEPLGDRTIMLSATDEGLPLYRNMGFEKIGSVFQHQGTPASVPPAELRLNERVRPRGAKDGATIAALDSRATGLDRNRIIAAISESARGIILDRNNEAVGYSLLRRFGLGFLIGPTIAPDVEGAKVLIAHWLGLQAGSFCRIDVPEDSKLSGWLEERGMPCVGRVTTMVRGKPIARAKPAAGRPGPRPFSLILQALG